VAGSPRFLEPHARSDVNLQNGRDAVLTFWLSDCLAAFPVREIERVTALAELARPPGLPLILEGILNLAGTAVPVLRLDRLFGLKTQHPGIYSMLIILRCGKGVKVAVLADRISEVLAVSGDALQRINRKDVFNGCAEAVLTVKEGTVHMLSADRVLSAKEHVALEEFQAMEQLRLEKWKAGEA
jgi:purine-binding chemotaxis protein CheW